VLARCHLWLMRLQQNRLDEADAVFESLRAAAFTFEPLAALLPEDVRQHILQAYQQTTGLNYFRVDAKRIVRLELALNVEKMLRGERGSHLLPTRFNLERALHASGEIDRALVMLEEMTRDHPESVAAMQDYCWVLRLRAQSGRALENLNRFLRTSFVSEKQKRAHPYLLLDRARIYVAQGQWDMAESDVAEYFRLAQPDLTEYHAFATACLLQGFLRDRKGDQAGALAAWRRGSLKGSPQDAVVPPDGPLGGAALLRLLRVRPEEFVHPLTGTGGTEMLLALVLGSLSNELTDAQVDAILNRLAQGRDSPLALLKGVYRLPPAIVRESWRTKRGRDYARRIAFDDLPLADKIRIPLILTITEALHQGAMPGPLTPQQDELLWHLAQDSFQAYTANRLTTAQSIQLAFTWKGTTNALGWGGIKNSLDDALRLPLSYVLGHRFVQLKKPKEATEFFRAAAVGAPPGSELRRLAQTELDRLMRQGK
jgi:tetratricopeptide (TPR) repeat protein